MKPITHRDGLFGSDDMVTAAGDESEEAMEVATMGEGVKDGAVSPTAEEQENYKRYGKWKCRRCDTSFKTDSGMRKHYHGSHYVKWDSRRNQLKEMRVEE